MKYFYFYTVYFWLTKLYARPFLYILNGIWIDHLDCVDKKANIKAENTDGVGTPARLSNDEIWLFDNKMGGQIYFRLVYYL